MRLVVDVGKITSLDGLGSFTRGLVGALARSAADDSVVLRFVDLLGAEKPEAVRDTLASALGESPDAERPSPLLEDLEELDAADESDDTSLLALTWQRPATFKGRALFVAYDLTFLTLPACHTLDNRIRCLEGCLQAAVADDLFLAISQTTADELVTQIGVPARRVEVISPAPAAAFAPRPGAAERVAERYGLRSGATDGYILAVGSLEPRKNLDTLLDAHELLPAELARRVPLALAGGGGWRNERLLARLDATADAGRLQRLGRPSDEQLADLYAAATLFVYPSLAEGFGLPLVEAMACGCPVVTGDRGATREVAGDAARCVDVTSAEALAAALRELLENPDARHRLAERGHERARTFTWTEAARRVLDAARRLTALD